MRPLLFSLGILLCILAIACKSSKETSYDVGQIVTPYGEMLFWFHKETPKHKSLFIRLANEHYWDSLTFNRVIKDFVIQGGCPDTPEGFGGSPYLLHPEFNATCKHLYGAVGAGRDDNPEKLSAVCQFYIVHAKEGIARLDSNYTIFGQVFKGFDVLDKIANTRTDSLHSPVKPVTMKVNIIQLTEEDLYKNGFNRKNKRNNIL